MDMSEFDLEDFGTMLNSTHDENQVNMVRYAQMPVEVIRFTDG
jgi:hypothetical protein